MKRLAPVLLVLLVLGSTAPASATPKILYASEEFQLKARLLPNKLVLAHVNLIDLPVKFRCRTEVEESVYRTHGLQFPRTVWRWPFPTDASGLGQATATCSVEVDDSYDVFFVGELLEVWGTGGINEDGEQWAELVFLNISPTETVQYGCTWQWGDPPQDDSSSATHLPHGLMNSISTLVEFSTISNMACTESVYDPRSRAADTRLHWAHPESAPSPSS